jgi:hypothetical protein
MWHPRFFANINKRKSINILDNSVAQNVRFSLQRAINRLSIKKIQKLWRGGNEVWLPFSKMWHYVSWQTSADDRSKCLTLTVWFVCIRIQGDTSRKTVISTVTGIRTTNLSYIRLSSLLAYLEYSTHFQPIYSPHNHYMTVTPFCVTCWMQKQSDLFLLLDNKQVTCQLLREECGLPPGDLLHRSVRKYHTTTWQAYLWPQTLCILANKCW